MALPAGNTHRLEAIGVAWFAMVVFDLPVHAVVLSSFYAEQHPALLLPGEAFARIPIGYLSYLLTAVLLVWILRLTASSEWQPGLKVGLLTGVLLWGSITLGMGSITTIQPRLLAGWFVGQTLQVGFAGSFAAAVLGKTSFRTTLVILGGVAILALGMTIVAQSMGWAAIPASSK